MKPLSADWSHFKKLFKGLELFHKKFADRPFVGVRNGVIFIDYPDELSEHDIEFLITLGWMVGETRATFSLVNNERIGTS